MNDKERRELVGWGAALLSHEVWHQRRTGLAILIRYATKLELQNLSESLEHLLTDESRSVQELASIATIVRDSIEYWEEDPAFVRDMKMWEAQRRGAPIDDVPRGTGNEPGLSSKSP